MGEGECLSLKGKERDREVVDGAALDELNGGSDDGGSGSGRVGVEDEVSSNDGESCIPSRSRFKTELTLHLSWVLQAQKHLFKEMTRLGVTALEA